MEGRRGPDRHLAGLRLASPRETTGFLLDLSVPFVRTDFSSYVPCLVSKVTVEKIKEFALTCAIAIYSAI